MKREKWKRNTAQKRRADVNARNAMRASFAKYYLALRTADFSGLGEGSAAPFAVGENEFGPMYGIREAVADGVNHIASGEALIVSV